MEEKLYAIGEIVPQSGLYVCVPCGYVQQFQEGKVFLTCEACLAGTENGPEGYQEEDAEFWSFVS
jgi:hypothetical protein